VSGLLSSWSDAVPSGRVRQLFGLQQLGLKDALRRQVAVDLNVSQKCAFVSDRTSSTLSSRGTGVQVEFFAYPASALRAKLCQLSGKFAGIGGRALVCIRSSNVLMPQILRCQADDLTERLLRARISRLAPRSTTTLFVAIQ